MFVYVVLPRWNFKLGLSSGSVFYISDTDGSKPLTNSQEPESREDYIMAGLYEMFFFISFIGVIGITLVKTYNVMSNGKVYNVKLCTILFISFLLCWGISFAVFMINPETKLYDILFRFETVFLVLNGGYFAAEILFSLRDNAKEIIKHHTPERS